MERLAAFWREFWPSIGFAESLPGKMKKLGEWFLFLLGPIGFAAWRGHLTAWLVDYGLVLLIVSAVFIVWKAGVSWERSNGPIIWVGPIESDEHHNLFEFMVRNAGRGEVIAHVYVVNLRDRYGKRIPRIDEQVEVHWRGLASGEQMRLYRDKHGICGVLNVNTTDNPKTPFLQFAMPASPKGAIGVAPLIPGDPRPLDKQEKVFMSLRVDFCDDNGKNITTRTIRYSIRPDPKSKLPYRFRRCWPSY